MISDLLEIEVNNVVGRGCYCGHVYMGNMPTIGVCKKICCNNPLYSFLGWRLVEGENVQGGECENGREFSSTMVKIATHIAADSINMRPRSA